MTLPQNRTLRVVDYDPKREVATGSGDPHTQHPKVSILFDDDVFITLRRRALREGTTFATQVRTALRKAMS